MKKIIISIIGIVALSLSTQAKDITQEWKDGLRGAKLAHYEGSVISNNSSLTVVEFCNDKRYKYYIEGSWYTGNGGSGASHSKVTGNWSIKQRGKKVFLNYKSDKGQVGSFEIYLERNGRVNIGGTSFSVQRGGAECS